MARILSGSLVILKDDTLFAGLYRDDGLVILRSTFTPKEVDEWFQALQEKYNTTIRSRQITFTCKMWAPSTTTNYWHHRKN